MTQSEEYLFLFADLKGSTKVANTNNELYQKYMSSFHWAVTRAKYFLRSNYVFPQAHFRRIIQNIEIIGDEVSSFTMINDATDSEKEDLVASSVSFLYMLELYWLASPINLEKLESGLSPYGIAAGLHIGDAQYVPSESSSRLISYNINITKGIQEVAKDCRHSRICATDKVKEFYNKWRSNLLKELAKNPELRPPLIYTGFNKSKKIVVRNEKIELWELSLLFKNHEKDIDALFQEMSNTIENDLYNYQAETASMVMSTNFLICKGNPFRYSDGRNAIDGCSYSSAKEYINIWFEALKKSNHTFIESSFMALNYLIISGSFYRHPEIGSESEEGVKYKNICKNLYEGMKKKFFSNGQK